MQDLITKFDAMTLALAKDGAVIKSELTPEQANLLHMAVGISGESGELLDAIKKHVVYQKPLDVENVKEELGDLLFYMSNMMQSVGLSFEEILQHNIDKLSVRYSSGAYSNSQAQERADKVDDVAKNTQTLTPFEVLCDKVLRVSDKHTLDMFIKNTYAGFTNPDVIPTLEDVDASFCWDETEQGHDFWSNIHTRVEGLEG